MTPNWYNTLYRKFTNIRTVKFKRTTTDKEMLKLLSDFRFYTIYTIIDHSPFFSAADRELIAAGKYTRGQLTNAQRIKDVDGEDYIDEFGRYVYIASRVGISKDIDMRYGDKPDPELFHLQYIEYDLCNRKPNGVGRGLSARGLE